MESINDIIKSTESGKLYVETSDFFALREIKEQMAELMLSTIYKSLVEKKRDPDKKNKGGRENAL